MFGDIIKVFYSPNDEKGIVLKTILKFTLKLLPTSAMYTHQQGPIYAATSPHIDVS
jgi:hypothetical protein